MSTKTVTAEQAARVADRTAKVVAKMRADADALEAAGGPDDVIAMGMTRAQVVAANRRIADSRERAGARVRTGARIVSAL